MPLRRTFKCISLSYLSYSLSSNRIDAHVFGTTKGPDTFFSYSLSSQQLLSVVSSQFLISLFISGFLSVIFTSRHANYSRSMISVLFLFSHVTQVIPLDNSCRYCNFLSAISYILPDKQVAFY